MATRSDAMVLSGRAEEHARSTPYAFLRRLLLAEAGIYVDDSSELQRSKLASLLPKGAGGKLPAYARETRVDAIGLDETVDPHWAAAALPRELPIQGNLDPLALIAGGEMLEKAVARIISAFEERPHIFNLGHGILPDTPLSHVEQLLKLVRR